MLPSTAAGKPQREFVGKQDPPILTTEVPGTTFILDTRRLRSISLGSPIFYRDIEVGTVLGWDLGNMARSVAIHAFIRAPFDKYVHDDSTFWNASGISIKLAGTGIDVQLEFDQGAADGRHRLRVRKPGTAPAERGQPSLPALCRP